MLKRAGYPFAQVDAFAAKPYTGNPAAVLILPRPRPAAWMQAVAREMNLSETAFLCRFRDGYKLRWFTPAVEVPLCGHATLASAHVLWESGKLGRGATARFYTRSGLLTAKQDGTWIVLDLPSTPPKPARLPEAARKALRVRPVHTGFSAGNYLVELRSEAEVRKCAPDFAALAAVDAFGFVITARSRRRPFDFVSRCFAPAEGVNEDPVTGSAHCALGPYWAKKLGKTDFLAYQSSVRGGVLRVSARGSRVLVSGKAVTVLRGELLQRGLSLN